MDSSNKVEQVECRDDQHPGIPPLNVSAVLNLGLYTVLMVVGPLCAFLLSSGGYLDPIYSHTVGAPSDKNRILYNAIAAVVAVNLVICGFVITAFREDVGRVKQD